MSMSFFTLPSELRNVVYRLTLRHSRPLNTSKSDRQVAKPWEVTIGLLYASKTVHEEASSVFYGQNCFDFTEQSPFDLQLWLEQIGARNAGYIRHIYLELPRFSPMRHGEVAVADTDTDLLAAIRGSCPDVETLTIEPEPISWWILYLLQLERKGVAREAMQVADAHYRTIPLLKVIQVLTLGNWPAPALQREMSRLGWKLSQGGVEYTMREDA